MAITFKSVLAAARALLQSKTVTAGTSDIVVQPDSGYDGLSQVTVEPTPSTAITPSDSSPAAMTSGQRYTPGANGYAIESYTSITPSTSGAAFSAGINKMSAAGYAYSSRPSADLDFRSAWLNSATGSQFAEQTVSLDLGLGSCKYVKINYQLSNNQSSIKGSTIVPASYFLDSSGNDKTKASICCNMGGSIYFRPIEYVSNFQIKIGKCTKVGSSTLQNSVCIPTSIQIA